LGIIIYKQFNPLHLSNLSFHYLLLRPPKLKLLLKWHRVSPFSFQFFSGRLQ
jgi:hypothetical protein